MLHHFEHLNTDGWSGRPCDCLTCRADRRGLSPWDYVDELLDQHRCAHGAPPFVPATAEQLAVTRCGCLILQPQRDGPWLLLNPCPPCRAVYEEQQRRAAIAAEQARHATTTVPPPPVSLAPAPPRRVPWWRRCLNFVKPRDRRARDT